MHVEAYLINKQCERASNLDSKESEGSRFSFYLITLMVGSILSPLSVERTGYEPQYP